LSYEGQTKSALTELMHTGEEADNVLAQVQANPTSFFGDPNRPAGGNIMAHACTHRVYLRKGSKMLEWQE
jgi:DNA repair protein RadA